MSSTLDQIADDRARREKETYDVGLDRGVLEHFFAHADYFYYRRAMQILRSVFIKNQGGSFLELGAMCWSNWIDALDVRPGKIVCINISERELEKGVAASAHTVVKPEFRLMDAHHLEFEAESFDVVFGGGILHHLDFARSLAEIRRVLKPGGVMVFSEPLDVNPVARFIRILTPGARTADEQPLRNAELRLCATMFATTFHFGELLSVPVGVVSKHLFAKPDNILMRLAFRLDEGMKRIAPAMGPLYRHVIMVGEKRVS